MEVDRSLAADDDERNSISGDVYTHTYIHPIHKVLTYLPTYLPSGLEHDPSPLGL